MHKGTSRRARIAGVATAVGACIAALLVATGGNPAGATTTITSPTEPGNPPVVRDGSVTIKQDLGALFYYKSASNATNLANATYSAVSPGTLAALAFVGRGCVGNNPAVGGKNNSPRSTISVTGPGGFSQTVVSPARAYTGGPAVASPPPPHNGTYLGDYPVGSSGTRGWSTTVDLTGKPAGIYTVTTVTQSMIRSDLTFSGGGTCQAGYPNPSNPKLAVLGVPTPEVQTFEYRPWQHNFVDVFGGGGMSLNVVPAEGRWTVNGKSSQIWSGPTYFQNAYTLPAGAPFLLPSDPAACVADLAECLPATAVKCNPDTGCVPRFVTIDKPRGETGTESLVGVFDLQTKAFIALAQVGADKRLLTSLGTELDAKYKSLLQQLAAAAAAQNVDLMSLLATKVRLRPGLGQEMSFSLLNGLQFNANLAAKGGIQIVSDTTVQAGVILHIYLGVSPNTCVSGSASSADGAGYTSTSGHGYTVKKSSLLPKIPVVGPLGAVVGGPIWAIKGAFPAGALVNTASAVVGIDTAADEPNGYPVWVNPFLSGINVGAPKKLDFLGTATWAAAETSLGGAGCFVTDLLLGTGVAVYNSPVGFSLQDVPALWDDTPTGDSLVAAIDVALQNVINQAASNPTVDGVLNQILGLLPL